MAGWAPFVVGGSVAIVIAAIELYNRLQSRPTARGGALVWWIGRLALEFVVGFLAIGTLVAAGGDQAKSPVSWFIAGAVGPAVARSRFVTFRQGSTEQSYGLSTVYEPIRDFFEARIDDIGAVEQDQWITNEVLPKLKVHGLVPGELVKRLSTYINALTRLSELQRAELITEMKKVLTDPEIPNDDDKVRYLVTYACKPLLIGFRQIGRFGRSG